MIFLARTKNYSKHRKRGFFSTKGETTNRTTDPSFSSQKLTGSQLSHTAAAEILEI
jgi:hypothetical protein